MSAVDAEFEEEEPSYHVMLPPKPRAPAARSFDRWLFFVGAGMLTVLVLGNLRNWSIGSVTLMVAVFTVVMFGRAFPRG